MLVFSANEPVFVQDCPYFCSIVIFKWKSGQFWTQVWTQNGLKSQIASSGHSEDNTNNVSCLAARLTIYLVVQPFYGSVECERSSRKEVSLELFLY